MTRHLCNSADYRVVIYAAKGSSRGLHGAHRWLSVLLPFLSHAVIKANIWEGVELGA